MNRSDPTDGPFHEQRLDFCAGRGIAVVEGDFEVSTGALNRIEDGFALFEVGRHRFFGDHVAARFQRTDDKLVVGAVDGGHDDRVRLRFADHPAEIRGSEKRRGGHLVFLPDPVRVVLHANRIHVAEAHQGGAVRIGIHQRIDEHSATAAEAYNGKTFMGGIRIWRHKNRRDID